MTAVATTEGRQVSVSMGFGSLESFEFMQRTAKVFMNSTMVPTPYRAQIQKGYGQNLTIEDNPAALPNCIIALNMATRMNADPLMIMQNLHIIEGRPSWSAPFIIAMINASGKFAPLRFHKVQGVEIDATYTTFEWENQKKKAVTTKVRVVNSKCIAWTVERGVQIPTFPLEELKAHGSLYACCKAYGVPLLESAEVSVELAVNEGWYGKNGSKWQTMPDQMLQYRSAAFFGRIYAPELLMGLPTDQELVDMGKLKQQEDGTYAVDETPEPPAAPPAPVSKSQRAAEAAAGATDAQVKTDTKAPDQVKETPKPETAKSTAKADTGELDPTKVVITANQVKYLETKIKAVELPQSALDALLLRIGAASLETLTIEQFDTVKAELLSLGA